MKKIKKVSIVFVFYLLLSGIVTINLYAKTVGSYSASTSAKTIYVGNSTKLTINCKKAAGKFSVTSSNPSVAKVTNSVTWVDNSTMDSAISIKGLKKGTATITITPVDVSDTEYNLLTSVKKITINVIEKAKDSTSNNTQTKDTSTKKSSDATLKSIELANGKIDFKPTTTSYTVDVDKTVDTLGLKAIANNSKATFKVSGDENFKIGKNVVKINVTAEDGTKKSYEIIVNKSKVGSGPITYLKVKGYYFDKEFDPSIYEYSIDVVDKDEIELEYKFAETVSLIEINGTQKLQGGLNIVTIKATETNGKVTTYTINVNNTKFVKENNCKWHIIIIIILCLVVIFETWCLTGNSKKRKRARSRRQRINQYKEKN